MTYREAGTESGNLAAGIPNILGYAPRVYMDNNTVATGALSTTLKIWSSITAGSNSAFYDLTFDASKVNTVYGSSDAVQPAAIKLIPQLRY